jgi:hypothetical protein
MADQKHDKIHGAALAADVTAEQGSMIPATARHTEGPWRVRTEIGTFGDVVDANDAPLAQAQLRQGDAGSWLANGGQPERQANAHLIAAAPELLAALKGLLPQTFVGDHPVERIVKHWEYEREQGNGLAPFVLAAYAAIAKAEGR